MWDALTVMPAWRDEWTGIKKEEDPVLTKAMPLFRVPQTVNEQQPTTRIEKGLEDAF